MTVRRLGPYRLDTLLGRGGMGEVWRAVDTAHGDRVVSLKLLGSWLNRSDEHVRRFRRESAVVAAPARGRRTIVTAVTAAVVALVVLVVVLLIVRVSRRSGRAARSAAGSSRCSRRARPPRR